MKKLVIILLMAIITVGCAGGESIQVERKTEVKIEKSIYFLYADPEITIMAESATFDGEKVTVNGIISIKGNSRWVVPKIEAHENQLIIPIPPDERKYYTVSIKK